MGALIKKYNQKIFILFAIFAFLILCAFGLFIYFEYFNEEEKEIIEEIIKEKVIDNRISPF